MHDAFGGEAIIESAAVKVRAQQDRSLDREQLVAYKIKVGLTMQSAKTIITVVGDPLPIRLASSRADDWRHASCGHEGVRSYEKIYGVVPEAAPEAEVHQSPIGAPEFGERSAGRELEARLRAALAK